MPPLLGGLALLPELCSGRATPRVLPPAAGGWASPSVLQADGSTRQAGGALVAQLVLGCLDEETTFVEFDVDCYADIILSYD